MPTERASRSVPAQRVSRPKIHPAVTAIANAAIGCWRVYSRTASINFAMLAMDDVERGTEELLRGIAEAGPDLHWIGFRLPIFSVLFSDRVKNHPGYHKALALACLDDVTRESIRAQAATLTPITGVEVGSLRPL